MTDKYLLITPPDQHEARRLLESKEDYFSDTLLLVHGSTDQKASPFTLTNSLLVLYLIQIIRHSLLKSSHFLTPYMKRVIRHPMSL